MARVKYALGSGLWVWVHNSRLSAFLSLDFRLYVVLEGFEPSQHKLDQGLHDAERNGRNMRFVDFGCLAQNISVLF